MAPGLSVEFDGIDLSYVHNYACTGMKGGDMDKVVGFVVCGAIIVVAQMLAVQAYKAWWDSETGGAAAVSQSTIQFITLVVSFGLGWLILKAWPEEPS